MILRPLITAFGLLGAWWLLTAISGVPAFLLPGPMAVGRALWAQRAVLGDASLVTGAEIVAGLAAGTLMGAACAIGMVFSAGLARWLMPLLLFSQAIPVFALAPILVLWLGFGMASKIAMAVLIIFFPVTAALADGLRRTEAGWLDLAQTMGASRASVLWRIRLPAALPAFGSGLRIAAAIAPVGAVIGEWVGASSGLGYVMLSANARGQTEVMFAALLVLSVMTILLWGVVDLALRRMVFW